MGRHVKDNKTIVGHNWATSDKSMSQEDWDRIFGSSNKKAFEEKYGKIVRVKMIGRSKEYTYINQDGDLQSIEISGE